ncbi:energy-coupling factor transporter transmembrane protein EcfT [Oscillibacter hominis]|uniref:Energy-coupling factor transporter transmembrane protein EcfT n=1 Tax=Oscillibacter hominis TaxID=2763056 RepID=A0A7G9B1D4_9FIRM|nr:energy-coupling factor transporter transmembrane component T [Oscillibacter hominis]QNL43365.1 energy-coupling factor transporter transmembrane protein EcfT [Oscillibacter hominis]
MLKDITLGQYFPGDTIAHRLDPRTKLILVVLYIVGLFCAKNVLTYAMMMAALFLCVKVSKVGARALLRGLKPVLLIIAFTAVLNLFFTSGDTLVQWWIFRITKQGLQMAVFMVLRITMLIMGTFLLTYTTSPITLTDGLESLMNPLKKLRVPVHELSMMMSIALRFIPTLIEETDKIMSAQKARGADFESGNLLQRAKAMIPLLVPLFISAFRRADELAVAMECRCYHGGEGRTKLHVLHYKAADYLVIMGGLVLTTAVIMLGRMGY